MLQLVVLNNEITPDFWNAFDNEIILQRFHNAKEKILFHILKWENACVQGVFIGKKAKYADINAFFAKAFTANASQIAYYLKRAILVTD